MADEYDIHLPGYWVQVHFRTLEEAREVTKSIIRSPGTECVNIRTMQEYQDAAGRTYWMLDQIELWAPRLESIDTADSLREVGGRVLSGKHLIGDEFVCFCISAEERQRRLEQDPDAP